MKTAATMEADAASRVNPTADYRPVAIGDRMRTVGRVAPITWMTPVAVEPRTRTDEHAPNKPLRAVVTIRGTGIRIIRVVAIGADRRRTHDSRADSDSHSH
jgi:hypothetical protein